MNPVRKKIIVVGGGFAGIQLVRQLNEKLFDVLLIDQINHHQFQPLFYQVATSQIEPSSISLPLRNIFKKKPNVQIRLAQVLSIVSHQNKIITSIGEFSYDFLVLATGCTTNFFGNGNIANHSFTLKTTYDAIIIRNHILQTFEKIISATGAERTGLCNLAIVGAGATGVELAGAFAEVKKNFLPRDYREVDFSKFNIYLIEGTKDTLSNMSAASQEESKKYLQQMGVTILTETFVKDYDGNMLLLSSGEKIHTQTVIWAAGVTGNTIDGLSPGSITRGNRVIVDRINKVAGTENIYAVGDVAFMSTAKYPKGHPQVANVAINQAKLLAKNLSRILQNKKTTEFEYNDLGSMAIIGRNKAVVDLPFVHFRGRMAWLTWMFLHLMLIITVKNKLIIFINWAWTYLSKDTSLRLILAPEKRIKKTKGANLIAAPAAVE
ncbi:MAG: NAD(P)/FAD-dependent oxidoreductase [Bacteroidetes bacterium]|nr:NAD(P)/FAD-dependent oxidoreductase [Bacteroidota bacterium]MBS1539322.1 NAD(P)/FAD-dependent oxidoreductase [Bacteroidota bacterium]